MPHKSFSSMGAGQVSLGLQPLWCAMTQGSFLGPAFLSDELPWMENSSPVPTTLESQNPFFAPPIICWTSQLMWFPLMWDRSPTAILYSSPEHVGAHSTSPTVPHLMLPSIQVEPYYYRHIFEARKLSLYGNINQLFMTSSSSVKSSFLTTML